MINQWWRRWAGACVLVPAALQGQPRTAYFAACSGELVRVHLDSSTITTAPPDRGGSAGDRSAHEMTQSGWCDAVDLVADAARQNVIRLVGRQDAVRSGASAAPLTRWSLVLSDSRTLRTRAVLSLNGRMAERPSLLAAAEPGTLLVVARPIGATRSVLYTVSFDAGRMRVLRRTPLATRWRGPVSWWTPFESVVAWNGGQPRHYPMRANAAGAAQGKAIDPDASHAALAMGAGFIVTRTNPAKGLRIFRATDGAVEPRLVSVDTAYRTIEAANAGGTRLLLSAEGRALPRLLLMNDTVSTVPGLLPDSAARVALCGDAIVYEERSTGRLAVQGASPSRIAPSSARAPLRTGWHCVEAR
jgi:hypothetical protein